MRTPLLLLLAVVVLAPASALACPLLVAPPHDCGTLRIGPGSLRGGRATGPACLLTAYRTCSPATFALATVGVDTVARTRFTVEVLRRADCEIGVSSTFTVVPRPTGPPTVGRCRALVLRGGDVVATGCSVHGLARSLSLMGAVPR